MIQKQIRIENKLGLHARAAAKVVRLASLYPAHTEIIYKNKTVNAKSILGLMMLSAPQGAEIVIQAQGDDSETALNALEKLIQEKFGESA